MTTSNVISANTFLSGIGVDTHIPYTDGDYANISNVVSHLQYLGINQIRDGVTNGQNGSAPLSSFIAVAKAGIQFTFVIQASTTADLTASLNLIDQVQKAAPGSVVAIEGPNEINNQPVVFNGVGGLQGALDLQRAIYGAVHSDPVLAGVPVDYFTGYDAGGVPVGPDPATTPGLADYDTQHPYPNFGQAPAFWVSRGQALKNTTSATEPAVYTETGYSSLQVSPAVQAKYTLDLLFDTVAQGISKTYLYQLMDAYAPGSPQGNDGWGLFDYNEVAKPVADALRSLTTILHDAGTGSVQPTALNYTITGLPSTGNSMLLEKSDGTYVLAVWAEPQIWNNTSHTEIAAPTQTATVTLPASFGEVKVFDPLSGPSAIAAYSNASTVQVAVSDHPILIQLANPSGTPPTTPPGGADTLVLSLSETPVGGRDAQFILSVDGHQVGGVQTVTALRSAGRAQDFTFQGDFG
ncbi:hypothetical protein, partial [Phenylobacterium sp.]|uniref:hypothetical protein n=1 Tax=Phenylobacterium sp. TaxID=1871053 RepID=UPI002F3EE438